MCKKVKYATEKDALFYGKRLNKTSLTKKLVRGAYLCDRCMCWHLTSKGGGEAQAKQLGVVTPLRIKIKSAQDLEIEKLKTEITRMNLHNAEKNKIMMQKNREISALKRIIKEKLPDFKITPYVIQEYIVYQNQGLKSGTISSSGPSSIM